MIPRNRTTFLCLDECIEKYTWDQGGSITISVVFGFIETDGTFTNSGIQQPETYVVTGEEYKAIIDKSKDGSISVSDLWLAVDGVREKINAKRKTYLF